MRILIADDHKIFRKSFISLLQVALTSPPECIEAANGLEALKMVETVEVDIIFLDVSMPEMNGIEAFKLLKEGHPNIPIIILTQFDDIALIRHFFKMGAQSFLTKNAEFHEIKTAMDSAMKGERYFPDGIQNIINMALKREEPFERVEFTTQEKRLFELLCRGNTSKEIAEKMNLTATTIDTYRIRLLEKTRTKNVAQLIFFGLKNGIT